MLRGNQIFIASVEIPGLWSSGTEDRFLTPLLCRPPLHSDWRLRRPWLRIDLRAKSGRRPPVDALAAPPPALYGLSSERNGNGFGAGWARRRAERAGLKECEDEYCTYVPAFPCG
ncbi:Hypothetical predicted protein [Podarcis lilfordi]|uniref:Uncharacterized protein n=1 Tax=Podarcis lilfordi TaxID=74358 RepID=A0AA35KK88_9SAUR|nr:Hypothetical predicted protein [Podarcis lilfordi]